MRGMGYKAFRKVKDLLESIEFAKGGPLSTFLRIFRENKILVFKKLNSF